MNKFGKTYHCIALLTASVIFLSVPDASCLAQSSASSGKEVERHPTMGIRLEVEVRDETGEMVTDLERKNFVLIDNGLRQEINHLYTEEGTSENQSHFKFILGYFPLALSFDGKYRRVHVVVKTDDGRKLSARTKITFQAGGNNLQFNTRYGGYYSIKDVEVEN